jgi:mRNA interferase MazF
MTVPEPFRAQVWDVDSEFGRHPAVVLSANPLNSRLGHVAVIPITGTPGPPGTHIPLDADAGLTRHDQSFADVTSLRPVARTRLRKQRGLLAQAEMARIETQLRTYLGL